MTGSLVRVRVEGPSGTIVLNRPEKGNAISRHLVDDLLQAFSDLHQERKVRAVILTGAGDSFSHGMDLEEIHAARESEDPFAKWHDDAQQFQQLLDTMLRFPKPIIAAVHGPAHGSGVGLVLAADIAIGSREATLSLPEPRRGLVAGLVAPLLVFRVGGGRAADLLLTTRVLEAERAQDWGIYQQLVPTDVVWAQAHELAKQCAASSAQALALTKRLLNEHIGEPLWTQIANGAIVTATAKTTHAAAEGVTAALEDRLPNWDA